MRVKSKPATEKCIRRIRQTARGASGGNKEGIFPQFFFVTQLIFYGFWIIQKIQLCFEFFFNIEPVIYWYSTMLHSYIMWWNNPFFFNLKKKILITPFHKRKEEKNNGSNNFPRFSLFLHLLIHLQINKWFCKNKCKIILGVENIETKFKYIITQGENLFLLAILYTKSGHISKT